MEWTQISRKSPNTFPPKDEAVLLCDRYGDICIGLLTEYGFERIDEIGAAFDCECWMPLPKPPECFKDE